MEDDKQSKILPTLDDLMRMGKGVEIYDGEFRQMTAASGRHHIIVSNIDFILQSHVRQHGGGVVFPDGLTYLMFNEGVGLKASRVPDMSFLRTENIPANWDIDKPHPGVPDLAVEVISPNDDSSEVHRKPHIYLEKGAEEVWVVDPKAEEVYQYRGGATITVWRYTGSATLDVDKMFPNLTLTTDAIFALPDWAK